MLHEADLSECGTEGTGLTGIEHQVLQSAESPRANDYQNCFYACRFCNGARHVAPNLDPTGRALLDPCTAAWADRFRWNGFVLEPLDADAEYTASAYDLNEPRKRKLRELRMESIVRGLRILREGPERIDRLLRLAFRVRSGDRALLIREARELRDRIIEQRRNLQRFRLTPSDADHSCRCQDGGRCELPTFLASQGIDLSIRDSLR